jgi:hypothetical protein
MGKDPPTVPPDPPGISSEGDMLGKTVDLKFMDHDVIDEKPIPKLAKKTTHALRTYRMHGFTSFPT